MLKKKLDSRIIVVLDLIHLKYATLNKRKTKNDLNFAIRPFTGIATETLS